MDRTDRGDDVVQQAARHDMSMDSPEFLLDGLNGSLLRLLGRIGPRLKDEDGRAVVGDLRSILRRTFAAQLLHSADFIAVAGTQGAGKTTLVCSMYDLDTGVLKPNSGLGESLPVLITEDPELPPGAAPTRWLHRVGEGADARLLDKEAVSEDDWFKAISNGDPRTIAVELHVAPRYFHGARRGFVLLPGYEVETRGNRTPQTLMRQALVGAQGAIVVTDRTRLADARQQRITADLANHLAKPVVVVAKSEDLSDADRVEVAATAAKAFDIEATEVVFTSLANRDGWLPGLMQQLTALDFQERTRFRQLRRLLDVADDLGAVEHRISELLTDEAILDRGATSQWETLVAQYDAVAQRIQSDIRRQLRTALDTHAHAAADRARKDFGETEAGLGNKLGTIFWHEERKDRRRRERLANAWDAPALKPVLAGVLERTSLSAGGPAALPGSLQRRALPAAEPTAASSAERSEINIPEPTLTQLELLARPNDAGSEAVTEDLRAAVRLLPVIGVHVLSQSMSSDLTVSDRGSGQEVPDDPNQIADRVFELVKDHQGLMLGLATILGLDMLDGDLDGPSATFGAIRGGLAAAGLSAGAATAVLGVAAAGGAIILAANAANRADRASLAGIDAAMAYAKDSTLAAVLDELADLLARGRDSLVERGREWHQLDAPMADRLAAGMALADVRERRVLLEKAINLDALAAVT